MQDYSRGLESQEHLAQPLFPLFNSNRYCSPKLHLERPIDLYKSHELEFLLLRLKSADIGWKTDDRRASRRGEIVTATTSRCMYLVEGGGGYWSHPTLVP